MYKRIQIRDMNGCVQKTLFARARSEIKNTAQSDSRILQ